MQLIDRSSAQKKLSDEQSYFIHITELQSIFAIKSDFKLVQGAENKLRDVAVPEPESQITHCSNTASFFSV